MPCIFLGSTAQCPLGPLMVVDHSFSDLITVVEYFSTLYMGLRDDQQLHLLVENLNQLNQILQSKVGLVDLPLQLAAWLHQLLMNSHSPAGQYYNLNPVNFRMSF